MSVLVAHVPSRRPDETLSSILLRLARKHSASAHEICTLLWPGHEIWTRDTDRTVSDASIAAISRVTGIDASLLERATLRGLVEALGLPQMRCGSQEGVLPVGVYHRVRRRFGQQYCSRCLDERPVYLRRLWRLEFVVSCPRHGALLRDACPICDAPFIPHRYHAMTRRRCHQCAAILTGGESISIMTPASNLQQAVLAILVERGAIDADVFESDALVSPYQRHASAIGGTALIEGVRRLCRLATRRLPKSPKQCEESAKVWTLLRTVERANVMARVGHWLDDWPKAWIEWAEVNDLTRHTLTSEYGPWPDWVTSAMGGLPYSHGPVNVNRSRWPIRLSELRAQHSVLSTYREVRAGLLLKKAEAMQGNNK